MRYAAVAVTLTLIALGFAVAVVDPHHPASSSSGAQAQAITNEAHMHNIAQTTNAANSTAVAPAAVKLIVKSDEEHGKLGPEGKWHDAFLPANFTVKPGQKVTVTVYNYDEGKHSFTDPMLGINATIAEGSANHPAKTTFTFTAPTEAGQYEWFCDFPCDPYSMEHKGYMRGDVTVS